MTEKELICRALLGNKQAQKDCTEKRIVLPCWRCGEEAEIKELHTGGKPIHVVSCKKHYCGAAGCAFGTQQKAIEYWNTRPAPPIGRCGECRHYYSEAPGMGYCDNVQDAKGNTDYCSYFEPKEEE